MTVGDAIRSAARRNFMWGGERRATLRANTALSAVSTTQAAQMPFILNTEPVAVCSLRQDQVPERSSTNGLEQVEQPICSFFLGPDDAERPEARPEHPLL